MKNILLIFVVALLTSCEMSEENKITNNYSTVRSLKGVLLFIESNPVKEYEILGDVNIENYIDQVEASNKNKKPLRALFDMGVTTFKNLAYNEKLNMLVDRAKEQFDHKVQGIIVQDQLKHCIAIQFKE